MGGSCSLTVRPPHREAQNHLPTTRTRAHGELEKAGAGGLCMPGQGQWGLPGGWGQGVGSQGPPRSALDTTPARWAQPHGSSRSRCRWRWRGALRKMQWGPLC